MTFDMEGHQPVRSDHEQDSVSWAVRTLIEAERSIESRHRLQEVIRPCERVALYARLLVSHFSTDRRFVVRLLRELRRYRRPLGSLLDTKDRWSGSKEIVSTLEDAILLFLGRNTEYVSG